MQKLFVLGIGGFVLGVASRSFFDFGIEFSYFLILLGVILAGYFLLSRVKKTATKEQKIPIPLFAGVFIVACGFGVLRLDVALSGVPPLDAYASEGIILQGIIDDEPDVRGNHTKLVFRAEKILNEDEKFANTKVLITAEQYPRFQYGDELIVRGGLENPQNFFSDDNSGRMFDYVSYLAKDGIQYQMFYPKIELVRHNQGNKIKQALFSLKQSFLESASKTIPEPHVSLLGGLLLGAKQSLGSDLLQDFRTTGLIHIVVLSGYNITIVAEAIGRAASFFPRMAGIILSSGVIVAFALMTGAGATVVRASLMALLVLLARATGRIYEITIALFAAGFLMVLWNPQVLIFDPSFQLSFLATIGLIYLAPHLERFFGLLPTRWQIREAATATVATQIFVMPLLLYMTGTVPVFSLLANLLVLPLIPMTMFFGFLTAVAGFLHQFISLPFAYLSYALLSYELAVVDILSGASFSSFSLPAFPPLVLVIIYGFFTVWLVYLMKRS